MSCLVYYGYGCNNSLYYGSKYHLKNVLLLRIKQIYKTQRIVYTEVCAIGGEISFMTSCNRDSRTSPMFLVVVSSLS